MWVNVLVESAAQPTAVQKDGLYQRLIEGTAYGPLGGFRLQKSIDQQKYLAPIVPARGNPRVLIRLAQETPQPHVNRRPKPGLFNNSVLRNHWTSDKSLPGTVPRRVSPQKVGRHPRHTMRQEAVQTYEGDGQASSTTVIALGHFSLRHMKRTWKSRESAQSAAARSLIGSAQAFGRSSEGRGRSGRSFVRRLY